MKNDPLWIAELDCPIRQGIGHVAPQFHCTPDHGVSSKLAPDDVNVSSSLEVQIPEAGPSHSTPLKTCCPRQSVSLVIPSNHGLTGKRERRKERRRRRRGTGDTDLSIRHRSTSSIKKIGHDQEVNSSVLAPKWQHQPRFWRPAPEIGKRALGYAYGYPDSRSGGTWRRNKYVRDSKHGVTVESLYQL